MKKLILILFSVISFSKIFAQEIAIDSSATMLTADTTSPIVIQYDTLSYAEEYKRDYWRTYFGVKFGVNNGRFFIDNKIVDLRSSGGLAQLDENGNVLKHNLVNNPTYSQGLNAGAFFRFVRGSFFLQPEILWSTKVGKFDVLSSEGNLLKRVNGSVSTIDIPILIGVRSRNLRVYFGPSGSFAFSMNKKLKTALSQYIDQENLNSSFFNRPIMNFNVGFGYEINNMFIDFRYEKGLKSYTVQDLGPANSPQSFNLKGDYLQISVGILGK